MKKDSHEVTGPYAIPPGEWEPDLLAALPFSHPPVRPLALQRPSRQKQFWGSIWLLVVASLIQLGWCSAQGLRDYPVRGIPIESDKFRAIFASVSAAEMASKLKQIGPYTNVQLVQNIGGQKYLAQLGEERIAVDLLEGHKKYADDTRIEVRIEDTGKIYEYIAILGNKKSVRLYREEKVPAVMTIEDFVARLKKGESFLIEIAGPKVLCRVCGGTGKVTDNSSKESRKIRCDTCDGAGGSHSSAQYRVLW